MSHLVSDLVAVLDALQIKKVRLVGHDHGALIGFQLCTTHPDRVDRFVAMSNGHPAAYARGPIEQKLKGWYVLFLQIRGLSDWVLRAGDWWFFGRSPVFRKKHPIGFSSCNGPAAWQRG